MNRHHLELAGFALGMTGIYFLLQLLIHACALPAAPPVPPAQCPPARDAGTSAPLAPLLPDPDQ